MVSAIVLAYNRCSEVLITIDKLKQLQQTLPFALEIIVVDNASSDNTETEIRNRHSDINYIRRKTNIGIAGWNDGFKMASHPYFLVLDDDSHIESGLEEVIAYMQQNPRFGIVALNITGGVFETSTWSDKAQLAGFIGCGAVIKREVFQAIGGFAEWLHVYSHEWEYGIRCLDAGYEIRHFHNSLVIHRTSSLNRTNKRVRIYSTRNEMAIIYKYFATHRWKYLWRVWVNSMKIIKEEGVKASYYCLLGGLKFLGMRSQIEHTPVSPKTQAFFAEKFWGTRPVLEFITMKFKRS